MSVAPTDAVPEVSTQSTPGPITQHTRKRLGQKAYGIVFLLVLALLLGLSIASFQKRFTPVVMVTLETDRLGSQLQESSDVKLRGLLVGEVRQIEVTPTGTRLELALQPDEVAKIPSNVSARLLPKTLFGERYVDLVTSASPARPIRAGDVIPQDRSRVAIELETVFDNLYPLLRTVQPAKLATTLNALSTTLDGRGDQIGRNIVLVDRYFKALNPSMPTIQRDITLLADTADLYAGVAPDFFRLTESLRVTNKTIVDKNQQLAAFLVGTAGFANEAAGFLRDNEQRIIQVGQVSKPTLQLLAEYSPIYPCVASGLVNWLPRANAAFSGGTFHITLEVVPPRKAYRPGEEPRWDDKRGPHCYGLPTPDGSQSNPFTGNHFADGTQPASNAQPFSTVPQALLGNASAADSGTAGTAEEQRVVGALFAQDGQASDPGASGIQTLLAGPMMRGTVVSTR
ncbi:MCE family protein [Terrabacter aerolatus]|uniref:ABC transporter substrate-binding protein n=1 Tax=Terrabacter aerolatus TaxID=422442 RepID=A0A512D1A4_9MICO|nr:MCE family protein [Terrabacter aerolatus]GEO30252.1 ABC transporter substrate-binding protein [Terrabacter aerolatus]